MWFLTLHHKQDLLEILNALQAIVDSSEYRNRWRIELMTDALGFSEAKSPVMYFYRKAERISSKIYLISAYFVGIDLIFA